MKNSLDSDLSQDILQFHFIDAWKTTLLCRGSSVHAKRRETRKEGGKNDREGKDLDLFKSPSEKTHELTIICRYERSEVQE